ncbi:gluconokinase [Paenibacillus thailandensis]|uniref:Gluconokinase n=1 Tax=Paenibacillus thailandensis TaxID=393250 RepID=A0ABW5QW94_9BACL
MDALNYMIGIDMGTTSTKAVLFEENGKVVAKANEEYPLFTPTPAIAEQDPDQIFNAVLHTINQVMTESMVDPERVLFVSFSSAMHSVIPVDSAGKPLMRCITWADNRSAAMSELLKKELNGHEIYRRTGTPIHPMSPLTKLMWLKREHPSIFDRTHKFISIKEYVFYKLFGEFVVDHSIASATGMMNLERLEWDAEALSVAGIAADRLSRLVPTTHTMTGLNGEYASQMKLSPSTPFVVGASDGVLSNLGVNAIEPGVVAVTIGTSGAIRAVVDKPITDPKGRYFCYALTDKLWVIGGAVNNGGVIFRWARDEFAASEVETAKRIGMSPYDMMSAIAERVSPGAEGLLFHPYFTGERAPLWNPYARGSFFGLSLHHKKEHMIRAVMEGIIFNLYSVLLALEEAIGRPTQIKATGGFARSQLWRQMMADIFDQNVVVPESFESSALGAVVLGLNATGRADSLNIVAGMVGSTHEHETNKANAAVYHRLMSIYISLARKLEDEYETIAKFQASLLEG